MKDQMEIINVRYYSPERGITGREYSYFTIESLKVGDEVMVPSLNGDLRAIVSAIDAPEDEIAAFKDRLRVIPSGSKIVFPKGCSISKQPIGIGQGGGDVILFRESSVSNRNEFKIRKE